MILLDGRKVADDLRAKLTLDIAEFTKKYSRKPCLKVIVVGSDPASLVYVKSKHTASQKVGMQSEIINLEASVTQSQLENEIHKLNNDPNVDGILVQLPVPKHIDLTSVLKAIDPMKDADGLTFLSAGYLWSDFEHVKPCTPSGVVKILDFYNIPVSGKRAVVVGRSQIVGKPMAALLLKKNATVTLAHSHTENLKQVIQESEIVIVAAGKMNFFGAEYFNKNHVVVDVGIHKDKNGKIGGDVDFAAVSPIVKAITPVPGGVGPMTIACLLENTVQLAKMRMK
ncbi:MAG: bifunctional 5,10-methylenetetrahydrofolate dehydrogenase/5,10-methenyltetrahydrofolate cyclohydrolase [Bdellovibrionaceae bacterium]|mgnify:FL=1|nr:bifunctional 5,10-methylenetetrahydrofolate dehydrogenase/5,10-methenyltetrahydrofolate cyclohydrolase [Pseudobdellovibrionaceae bacterium]